MESKSIFLQANKWRGVWCKCPLQGRSADVRKKLAMTGPYCRKCEARSEAGRTLISRMHRLIWKNMKQRRRVSVQESAVK